MPEPPSPGMWQYLKDYGVVEAILAIFTILLGVAAIFRGSSEKRANGGPLGMPINGGGMNQYQINDALQIFREMKEDGRDRNRILQRIENKLNVTAAAESDAVHLLRTIESIVKDKLEQERLQTMLLEDLRNNQVMRGETSIGLPRRK